MAKTPHRVTRTIAFRTGAPPVMAETAPRAASAASESAPTVGIACAKGVIAMAASGTAAPTEKVAAEASAASTGRVATVWEMPISSRACASSALWLMSCTATSPASAGSSPRPS